MAGALSGHLLNSYYMANQSFNSPLVSNGNISFDPNMHGTSGFGQQSFSFLNGSSFANEGLSDATAHKIAALQVKLNQKLGPEYISQRPGPGGGPKLTYAEGWKIINLANEVFGFNGWSSSIVSLTTDFIDYNEESRRYTVGVTAVMRVTLKDGVFHEDIGYGMLENSKSKGAAIDKCKKEAVTDGLKRALRNFGNLLGNCLYDKSYTQEVIKIKLPPPKFDKSALHRRPEFQEAKPNIASTSTFNPHSAGPSEPPPPNFNHNMITPTRPPPQAAKEYPEAKPQTSLPPHMRSEVRTTNASASSSAASANQTSLPPHMRSEARATNASASSSSSGASANQTLNKGKAPAHRQHHMGTTPISAPSHPQQPQPQPQRLPRQPHEHSVTFKEPPSAQPPPPPPAVLSKPSVLPPAALAKAEDGDESFNFDSDDDAFLAAVDLGDGDTAQPMTDMAADMGRPIEEDDFGRPVDVDTDMGRPLNYADDFGGAPVNNRSIDNINAQGAEAARVLDGGMGSSKSTSVSASRMSAISTALNESSRPAAGMLSKLLPQQQPATNSNAANQGAKTRPSVPLPPQKNQQHNASRPQQQNQNANPHSNADQASANSSIPRRPSTPSMGGFHFPLGVQNPLREASSSGIGTKRPADAMATSTSGSSSYRGSRPGMGLQQASGGQGRREVLGLDVGEGGDVKRARR